MKQPNRSTFYIFGIAAIIVLFTVVSPSLAQGPERSAEALAMLNRAFTFLGGRNLAPNQEFLITGTITSLRAANPANGTFTAKVRGDDFSFETSLGVHQSSYRVLGGVGTVVVNGEKHFLAPHNTNGLRLDVLPLISRWTEFFRPDASVAPPTVVEREGKSLYLLRVELPDQLPDEVRNDHGKIEIFVDPLTGMVVGQKYLASQTDFATDRTPIEHRFDDYQRFGDFLLPTHIVRYRHGQPAVELRITQVEFPSGLSDADFRN